MDLASTSNGMLKGEAHRRKIVYNPTQRSALQSWFAKNPYPGIAAREHLAKQIGVPESRVQVWFQNRRARWLKQPQAQCGSSSGEEPSQRQEPWQPRNQMSLPKEARRKRTSIKRSQTSILVEAFQQNRFPGIKTREELAKKTGLPEERIQVWFQNRRARQPGRSPRGPVNSLANAPNRRPQLIAGSGESLFSRPHHLTSCNVFYGNQEIPPTLWSLTPSVPQVQSTSCMSQASVVQVDQPTVNVQVTAAVHPQTPIGHLPGEVSQGRRFSEMPPFVCPPLQAKCQDPYKSTGAVVVPSKDNLPHQPETIKQQLKDVGQTDTSKCMEWRGEELEGANEAWESRNGQLNLPGHSEMQLKQEQAEAAGGPSLPPAQEYQQDLETWNLLEQILSSTEFQEMAPSILSTDLQGQDSHPAEPILSDEEFQALLDML